MSTLSKIKILGKSFYPRGRAFKIPFGSDVEKINSALSESESRAYDDAVSILDSALPDNANFTSDDATQWERRLGLITNLSVSLTDRKLAIIRKMRHPGNIPARQNYLYLQGQLQAAGFNVFVHENIFPTTPSGFVTKTALNFAQSGGDDFIAAYGNFDYGEFAYGQLGEYGITLVVNNIDEVLDSVFDVGANLRSTFFIGGDILPNLIANPNFDDNTIWTLSGGLNPPIISGGVLIFNNTTPAESRFAFQTISPLVIGKEYTISFNISNYVSGTPQLVLSSDTTTQTFVTADGNGIFEVNFTATDTWKFPEIAAGVYDGVPTGLQQFDVDNIILKEYDQTVFADVDLDRQDEFRQLILKIKPVQTVAYLLCNYV